MVRRVRKTALLIITAVFAMSIVSIASAEESASYTRTKIKNRTRVQTSHAEMFKGSKYNYTDDSSVEDDKGSFGNVEVDSADTKKVYNYVDVKKHIHTNEALKAGNVKVGEKGKVKGVYNYVHVKSAKSKDKAEIGNLNIEKKKVRGGTFESNVEVEEIKIR